jgi:hypothetical protein
MNKAVMLRFLSAIFLLMVGQSCFLFQGGGTVIPPIVVEPLTAFLSTPSTYPIKLGNINEASGMVASHSIPGNLWVIEDGDNPSSVHLLSTIGEYRGKIDLPIANRDWEDLALGPGPIEDQNYLYIAETGDNVNVHPSYTIHRLKEPTSLADRNLGLESFRFKYNDRTSIDVEAMFVEPKSKDIYLISKQQLFSVRLYKIAYPYDSSKENIANFIGTIPHSGITAADISTDGSQLMIKDYNAVFYWRLKENETIYEALSRARDVGAPYYVEPQGESLCFDAKNSGYFTLSELSNAIQVNLYYYQRKVVE